MHGHIRSQIGKIRSKRASDSFVDNVEYDPSPLLHFYYLSAYTIPPSSTLSFCLLSGSSLTRVPLTLLSHSPLAPSMGNCTSTLDCQAKAHLDTIDKEIENNSKDIRKECKIIGGGVFPMMPRSSHSSVVSLYKQNTQALNCPTFSTVVLNDGLCWSRHGSGESGNSSIVKRMKIIHQNGFSWEELLTYWMTVYRNLVDSAQAIVLAMRKIRIDCETPINRTNCDRIIDYHITTNPSSLNKKSPSSTIPGLATVVNGVDVSGIGNGGGTAEGFDPVIPKRTPLTLGAIFLPLEECEVDETEDIDEVIANIKKKKAIASQTRAIVAKIPLPEIPPLVIALIPTNGKDTAESIHEQHMVLLKMAACLELKVLVMAADGAAPELAAQEMMD
ncbi:hypothetical protein PILCRDRAFT_10263 [Piloderma croceum F 1598]|uniref:Uncharacterized protein n=1 Tax=Piloderma croceum (strain F 1598) TaxID=765440 RepID=A0A0C3BQ29_PILCF|nr:hypothetical protein PILCRDRAFT_10263 [Piloderma croceum F 1598]